MVWRLVWPDFAPEMTGPSWIQMKLAVNMLIMVMVGFSESVYCNKLVVVE